MEPRTARVALSLTACIPGVVWTASLLTATPPVILFAATAPAAVFAVLIVLAQERDARPPAALALALLWGATGAALLSTTGNQLALAWLQTLDPDSARTMTTTFVAPALEECAKALGLALVFAVGAASRWSVRDGIVYGAMIGVGFVWAENFLYLGVSMLQGGEEGLLRSTFLRGILGGATHSVFTAASGAGFGWWAATARGGRSVALVPTAGVAIATVQHAAWNAFAAPMIQAAVCAPTSTGACAAEPGTLALFGHASLIAAVFLAPGAALVAAAWRSSLAAANEGRSPESTRRA